LHVVVVGHVDHGKSTLVGRLMADLGVLPEGKIEQIRAYCANNARPFEFAFLLDALKNEQSQGITIETARCFVSTPRRDYLIYDAPGHVEFLKNMVTGASRAEAALLVIDAEEGVQENSRRHGFLVSMLGIRQVAVLINKMDRVGYSQSAFEKVRQEFSAFLSNLAVEPCAFIPISAREGVNISSPSPFTPWYTGPSVKDQLDSFTNGNNLADRPFRMPVQDIYKFTAEGDNRRILAGTIETGRLRVGDEVVFWPSGKRSGIRSVEEFNRPPRDGATAGEAIGVTLTEQIYLPAGEIMCRAGEPAPAVASRFRVSLFWLGRSPMIPGKRYKLKLGTARTAVELVEVRSIVDAGDLTSVTGKQHVDRHDAAECILETAKPVAFDPLADIEVTSRFVIVDGYDIAACGSILEPIAAAPSLLNQRVERREMKWEKGYVANADRARRNGHEGKFIVVTGGGDSIELARLLEKRLFLIGCQTYYLSIGNLFSDLSAPPEAEPMTREEQLERLGELAHLMADSGVLFITALAGLQDYEVERLSILSRPFQLVLIGVGSTLLKQAVPDFLLEGGEEHSQVVETIIERLTSSGIVPDYQI